MSVPGSSVDSSVYLDHAATTPMLPAVRDAYVDALGLVGNPSSIHGHGQAARDLLETGREQVAASLGVDAVEVVFTGGGTEAVNLAIKGTLLVSCPSASDSDHPGRARRHS